MMKTEYYNQRMEKFKEMKLISFITKNNIQGKKVYYNTGVEMKNVLKGTKSMLFSRITSSRRIPAFLTVSSVSIILPENGGDGSGPGIPPGCSANVLLLTFARHARTLSQTACGV